jgi:neutral ceramidase
MGRMMRKPVLLLMAMAALPAAAADLRAGAASVRITPPVGAPMAGYYYHRGAEGTHDDLMAKALVFEAGGAKAALVACDLIGVPAEVADEARRLIAQDPGIPAERVMISATHAHTGPLIVGGASRTANLEGEMLAIARRYAAELPGKIAESVRKAHAGLAPAKVSAAVGREETISFNRRFWMKDGTVGWNPGKLNPNIVKPAGPIDPAVPVLYVETADGKPLATYVNFALHLDTVGGLRYSADYPYTLASLLGRVKGPEMVTLFTMGASGNVNHIDVSTRAPQKGHEEAARIGTVLAGEVLKSYARLQPVRAGTVAARRQTAALPLAKIEPGEVEKARAVAEKYGLPDAPPFNDMVHAYKVQAVAARGGKPLEAEVQVIALGRDTAFVGLPGEIFTELGMAIRKASPFRYTIVVTLANGSIGYVPDRAAYAQGAYEVSSARCAPGSGELLVEAALKILNELRGNPQIARQQFLRGM